jgi:hypothetical protein
MRSDVSRMQAHFNIRKCAKSHVALPVIPALRMLRQKHPEFEANLGYTGRPYLKKMRM